MSCYVRRLSDDFLQKLILFYHFGICQRPNTTSFVYKNLRKVLRFVYGFSEIL
nr:MAG TPA: hypothetical protein [Caudoviricetes sp.]